MFHSISEWIKFESFSPACYIFIKGAQKLKHNVLKLMTYQQKARMKKQATRSSRVSRGGPQAGNLSLCEFKMLGRLYLIVYNFVLAAGFVLSH